jgi:hypothetical protein
MYPEEWAQWQTQPNPVGVGVDVDRQIAIYHRWDTVDSGATENFVIVLNFSDSDQHVEVPFPTTGEWDDLLSGFDGRAGQWSLTVGGPRATVDVGSHWGRVLWRLS